MSVTEKLMAVGQWSLSIIEDAPEQLIDLIDYFDHVVVVSQRLSPFGWSAFGSPPIADEDLLNAARYVGVITHRPVAESLKLAGKGLVWWLADSDGIGLMLRGATKQDFATKSFQSGVRDLLNVPHSPLLPGSIESTAGTYTHTYDLVVQRYALEHFIANFGGEYRVNPNFTVDAGASGFLFVDPATSTISRKFAGEDPSTSVLKAQRINTYEDIEEYLTTVIVAGEGTGDTLFTREAQLVPESTYKIPFGDDSVKREQVYNEPDTPSADAHTRAHTLLDLTGIRKVVVLSLADYHVQGRFEPGDLLNVWDPKTGLVDPTNELTFRGQTINPVSIRCVGMTWPLKRGMGVYIRRSGAVAGWIDITDYVNWESGDVAIEVGATSRNLDQGTREALLARITIDPDGNDHTGPNTPVTSSTPWNTVGYLDAMGIRHSRIIPVWELPTNTDGTVVTDGSHFTLRFRPSGETVYSFLDVPWGNLQGSIDGLSPGTQYQISIAACDLNGNCSGFGPDELVTAAQAGSNPSQPAAPVVTGNPLGIQVSHDLTKEAGGNLDNDLDHIEVHGSTISNFVPSSATLLGSLPATAAHIALGLEVIGAYPFQDTATRYIRIVAVDREGNSSAPSPQATVSASLIDTRHITNLAVTTAKIGNLQVTDAKIQNLRGNKIIANTITSDEIQARTIRASDIQSRTITANEIRAHTITANELEAHTITANELDANAINVEILVGGTINTTEITVGSVMTLGGSGVIRTADTGQRVELNADHTDRIAFYSGASKEATNKPAHIFADSSAAGAPFLGIRGPTANWGQSTPNGGWHTSFEEPELQSGDPALRVGYDGDATGDPYFSLEEHMVLTPGMQIFLTAANIADDPAHAIMPGMLTKLDPPTWRADTTNPTPSAYNEDSVGFWIRVGDTVWFSVTFQFNAAGVSSTDDGVGAYYWDPALDGAPAIDMNIYANSEDQSMVCGTSGVKRGPVNQGSLIIGLTEIDNTSSRIYGRWGTGGRFSNTHPFVWDESDFMNLTGTYTTAP